MNEIKLDKHTLETELSSLTSYTKIAKKYNINRKKIPTLCKEYGILTLDERRRLNEEKICNDYINNLTIDEIRKKYKISDRKIYELIKKYNLSRRDKIFEILNQNKDMLYYLAGLTASDGYLYDKKNRIEINLQLSDVGLIDKITEYLGLTTYIDEERNRCSLMIHSLKLFNFFKELGMSQNKSKDLSLNLDKIDLEFTHAFIRGYFDGDGTIFCYEGKYRANIVGNKDTMHKIYNILIKNDIHCVIYDTHAKNVQFDFYRVAINKKEDIIKFRDYIYKNNFIYLDRKYNKLHAV